MFCDYVIGVERVRVGAGLRLEITCNSMLCFDVWNIIHVYLTHAYTSVWWVKRLPVQDASYIQLISVVITIVARSPVHHGRRNHMDFLG